MKAVGRWGVGAFLLFAGCARTNDPVKLGRAVFLTSGCAACHAVGPDGPTTGTNLGFIGFSHTPEFLDLWLTSPHGWRKDTVMPEPNLQESSRKNLVAYLSTLKGQSYTGAASGQEVFRLAGCTNCHGPSGKGGFPNNNVAGGKVPALTGLKETYTKAELIKKLRNGVPHPEKKDAAGPDPMLTMPAWGRALKDPDLEALADYLLALSKDAKSEW